MFHFGIGRRLGLLLEVNINGDFKKLHLRIFSYTAIKDSIIAFFIQRHLAFSFSFLGGEIPLLIRLSLLSALSIEATSVDDGKPSEIERMRD